MKRSLLSLAVLGAFATGCTGMATVAPVEVLVPVQVPCKAPQIVKPAFAMDGITPKTGLYVKTASAIAEINQRKAYEARLEAAVKACQ